jgi:hypothetical protein
MAEKTYCTECGDPRTSHSVQGCTECPCKVRYMDRDKFEPR